MGKTYRAIVNEALEVMERREPRDLYELTYQCEPCWKKWEETSPSQMGSSTCPRCKKQVHPIAVELA
jgi:DNA-directed RNA polymerase subunit RPC12/RpoP